MEINLKNSISLLISLTVFVYVHDQRLKLFVCLLFTIILMTFINKPTHGDNQTHVWQSSKPPPPLLHFTKLFCIVPVLLDQKKRSVWRMEWPEIWLRMRASIAALSDGSLGTITKKDGCPREGSQGLNKRPKRPAYISILWLTPVKTRYSLTSRVSRDHVAGSSWAYRS